MPGPLDVWADTTVTNRRATRGVGVKNLAVVERLVQRFWYH